MELVEWVVCFVVCVEVGVIVFFEFGLGCVLVEMVGGVYFVLLVCSFVDFCLVDGVMCWFVCVVVG